MKRLFYLMLVVLGIATFVSCSKDDDGNNNGGDNNNGEGVITAVVETEKIRSLWIGTSKEGETITVDWGDGNTDSLMTAKHDNESLYAEFIVRYKHDYKESGTHTITIKGNNIIEFGWEQTGALSIDASKCTTLQSFLCDYYESIGLTDLNIDGCYDLVELSLSYCNLTHLDISKYTKLIEFDCAHNQLTSLDVTKNTALTKLHCYGNQLTSLDVRKNTTLTDLSCDNNQLTSLDVTKNIALTSLRCADNQLTSLDVTQNTALTELNCSENQLTSLDISNCAALTYLWCYDNQFTGAEMNKIYEALPTVESGYLQCNELGNWSIAEEKGWTVNFN